jgi:putative endonuclease
MKGFVYILTNVTNSVLYTGVTSDIKNRLRQHKSRKHINSFTARYNLTKLVYVEEFISIGEAIKREKQIKAGSRKKKVNLVTGMNPDWDDLIRMPED